MRTRLTTRTIVALVVSAVLALGAVPGALADQTISDPAGDAGSAPDISAVSVSNDSSGNVTLTVTTNQPQLETNAAFFVYLDTDSNPSTGIGEAGLGADYFLIADATGAFLAEVQGSTIFIHLSSTATASYLTGTETVRVNRSDLGDASKFKFLVESDLDDGNGTTIASDNAPDGPPYPEYQLSTGAPLTLSLGRPAAAGRGPVAGKRFVLSGQVTRSDGAQFTGSVSCKARAGSVALRAAGAVSAGSARCSMLIPKRAKGRMLRGTMTVSTAGAESVSRSFALRIR